MPSYVEGWDVTKPAGTRDRALGDDDIREFKRAIAERLNEDHYQPQDETGVLTVGYHRKATLVKLGSNPGAVANSGILFTKDAGAGAIELYYIDAAGNVTQLTNAGSFAGFGSGWPVGTKILSSNTSTPSGFTDVSGSYDNSFIRISSGTPLTTGGANTHNHGGTTGSYTLTTADIPAHTHTVPGTQENNGGVQASFQTALNASNTTVTSGSTGGAGGHSHSMASADNIPVYVALKLYSKN